MKKTIITSFVILLTLIPSKTQACSNDRAEEFLINHITEYYSGFTRLENLTYDQLRKEIDIIGGATGSILGEGADFTTSFVTFKVTNDNGQIKTGVIVTKSGELNDEGTQYSCEVVDWSELSDFNSSGKIKSPYMELNYTFLNNKNEMVECFYNYLEEAINRDSFYPEFDISKNIKREILEQRVNILGIAPTANKKNKDRNSVYVIWQAIDIYNCRQKGVLEIRKESKNEYEILEKTSLAVTACF